ncbi:hypothetical protein [Mycobacterium palustre]|uniref:Uncharacterized protein n=1 Tax=Mycobacterium palustre TaxID=153971 RepID=A0A1X1ZL38_9MYCO|nr:hypothetical protein [Mycobacterium palustre]ORW24089.1 hypothetical protein AWC19_10065 [Mycobacterium palustre]
MSIADLQEWDPEKITELAEAAAARARASREAAQNIPNLPVFSTWHGEASETAREAMAKTGGKLELSAQDAFKVAVGAGHAAQEVTAVKKQLADIFDEANAAPAVHIDTKTNTVTPPNTSGMADQDVAKVKAKVEDLQHKITALLATAEKTNGDLAAVLRTATGTQTPDAAAQPPAGAPPAQARPTPAPGSADPAGKPPTLEDLMLGRGQPANQQPAAGSLPDLLARLHQPAPGAPAPQLNPADVESFKAMARQSMAAEGVPPDQIEARLNAAVANTQQWMNNGMPNYVPPTPQRPPPPGFGEGFGDRWRATEQGIKNLIGQGGPGAPGVLESWEQMVKGAAQTAQNPFGAAAGEIANAVGSPSPAYYAGGKAADAAVALPGMLFGGEGAAIAGEVGEIGPGVLETGPAAGPHVPLGFDHLPAYNAWAEQAAMDLNYAFAHGGPTPELSQQLADMSTHYIGDNPDRVVLGKFAGPEDGYIGEARGNGGIYFDTGNPTWNALTSGLTDAQERGLAWQVNQQFLQTQMEDGVSRIEYVVPKGFSSLEDVVRADPKSFSAMEIRYLTENAAQYGYERVGNSWVRVGGG